MRTLLIALSVCLLSAPAAYAQTGPIEKAGVDLEFSCSSASGERVICSPERGHYGRYPALANWRFVGGSDACRFGETYGYDKTHKDPWVSGQCRAIFRAPNLRFGDSYNADRV